MMLQRLVLGCFLITCSYFSLATPISCLDIGNGNGSADMSCVVNSGDIYTWQAADPVTPSAEKSYTHTIGRLANDRVEDVASVLAFLFDTGISTSGGVNPQYWNFLLDPTGSQTELNLMGKSDDNYGSLTDAGGFTSGTFSIPDPATIMTVKSATSFSINIFSSQQQQGDWSTAGISNGGANQPALSHISFWESGSLLSTYLASIPTPSLLTTLTPPLDPTPSPSTLTSLSPPLATVPALFSLTLLGPSTAPIPTLASFTAPATPSAAISEPPSSALFSLALLLTGFSRFRQITRNG
ncbi:hypothetical protein PTW35_13730 [Photobacterium sp. DA100]|uniref:hypothetical protein n=1 Tax=Photobacterium sp. DA100 TaxID=3027472 RepID=UPI00247B1D12|nr:hypothetical protein [Photobacterium sp. DA100]WEM41668.1 hypothetical protein PTW35_13730 [Photobacterium sp. DA100]